MGAAIATGRTVHGHPTTTVPHAIHRRASLRLRPSIEHHATWRAGCHVRARDRFGTPSVHSRVEVQESGIGTGKRRHPTDGTGLLVSVHADWQQWPLELEKQQRRRHCVGAEIRS
eukprot:4017237-Prymnesium_polylepis.1